MKKHAWRVGLALLLLVLLAFQSCDSRTFIPTDGELKGPYSLSTSDPLCSEGTYRYHTYSFDVVAGKQYELGLCTDTHGVGLSIWEAGYEDVVLVTYSYYCDTAYRWAAQTARVEFSVWINNNRLVYGPAEYEFYIEPVN